jgi:hypothetical protein
LACCWTSTCVNEAVAAGPARLSGVSGRERQIAVNKGRAQRCVGWSRSGEPAIPAGGHVDGREGVGARWEGRAARLAVALYRVMASAVVTNRTAPEPVRGRRSRPAARPTHPWPARSPKASAVDGANPRSVPGSRRRRPARLGPLLDCRSRRGAALPRPGCCWAGAPAAAEPTSRSRRARARLRR